MARLTHRTEAHIRQTADVDRLKSAIRAIKQRLGASYYAQSMASAGSAGGSAHVPVTLGAGSDPALALSGQQVLTLADVLTPTEHTAIGDAAPHHARAHTVTVLADHPLTGGAALLVLPFPLGLLVKNSGGSVLISCAVLLVFGSYFVFAQYLLYRKTVSAGGVR